VKFTPVKISRCTVAAIQSSVLSSSSLDSKLSPLHCHNTITSVTRHCCLSSTLLWSCDRLLACAIFLSQETQKEKEEQKAKEQANALQVHIMRLQFIIGYTLAR